MKNFYVLFNIPNGKIVLRIISDSFLDIFYL